MLEDSNFQVTMNEYLPLRDVVFNTLRHAILKGELEPGERLMEISLAQKLGVSRTPIREAIRKLELEGLVSIIPNKGAFVEGVSTDDIRDIYEIRALLEGLCARWAATRISDELMAAMEENIYLTEFHEKKGNAKKLLELDNRFHELLYEAGGSKELMRVLKDYHEYVGRVRKVTLGETKRAKNSTHEHKQICEAIKNHDALLAEKCAREHINNSKENMEHLGWENLIK